MDSPKKMNFLTFIPLPAPTSPLPPQKKITWWERWSEAGSSCVSASSTCDMHLRTRVMLCNKRFVELFDSLIGQ